MPLLLSLPLFLIPWSLFIAPAPMPRSGPATLEFPTYGLAVALPDGWGRVDRDRLSRGFRFVHADPTRRPDAQIVLNIGKPIDATARITATTFATDYGGVVDAEPTTFAGVAAERVRIPKRAGATTEQPREALICLHDGRMYMLIANVEPDATISDAELATAFDEVRASIRWIKPISALDAAETLGWALRRLPGAFDVQFQVPEDSTFDTKAGKIEAPHVTVSMRDGIQRVPGFEVTLSVMPIPAGKDFDGLRKLYGDQFEARTGGKPPVAWESVSEDGTRYISNGIPMITPDAAVTARTIWAMVKLDAARYALLNFTVPAEEPEAERTKRSRVVRRFVESVRAVPAPATR